MTELTASYVHGAAETPLLGQTIGQALERAAASWADHTALIARAQGIRWTWRELRDRADAFAAGLVALGLRRGDRIGIWSLNRVQSSRRLEREAGRNVEVMWLLGRLVPGQLPIPARRTAWPSARVALAS